MNSLARIKNFRNPLQYTLLRRTFVTEFDINFLKNEIKNNSNQINNLNILNYKSQIIKKPKKLRPHINPFSVKEIIKIPKWDQIYSNLKLPFHIDLGCGQGEMLLERSLLQKDKNMLGIDMRDVYIDIAKNKQFIKENNTINTTTTTNNNNNNNNINNNNNNNNLHYIIANINLNIKNINLSLPKDSIKEISIFFPDPCFKKSHHKRRLINKALVKDLYESTADDVVIYIQTDQQELGLDIQQHFISSNLFIQQNIDSLVWNNLFPKSKYQRLFSQDPQRYVFIKKIEPK
ncbi:hypothetical protein DICPUDRAFT_85484 [Dictyostelium purpureum]|uniref:tRNA (guanine(46)-N(7))-methyltransferase n=1 Tax=Dictyostelium purpureum TaxID=5786 RepID=F1A5V7_DICPU|nr:uncharacterized protein DICPUDRAFT_85484 [Dictyostelium purpureum]EGC28423.1 hypothetical protein DICPUDRAFT_85484 [Dictyostelium purpureum]|eukprot:XP_003295050.1 hypothetical protein DICPUDRAFT_85484 [Dictyostelium purpureum]